MRVSVPEETEPPPAVEQEMKRGVSREENANLFNKTRPKSSRRSSSDLSRVVSASPVPSSSSSPATMERRGSRARRKLTSGLMVDTALAAAGFDADEEPPVIDTTSAAVERKADGSVAKVNEYVVVRDLGQGTSAEVKLCRLVLPALSNGGEAVQDVPEDEKGHGDDVDGDGGGDLYAVKSFDRAKIMRRGGRFARPRERGPDGVIVASDAVDDNFVKVQREIAIMKKITHPNVVQLVEVIDAPTASSLYMVMEYVERGAVMCCVDPERGLYACPKTGGCLDARTAARYFADILAGLECLHLHLIAHRDLKPENVLIGDDGRAKIADFGVSQHFTDDAVRTPKSARSLARSNSRAQMSNAEGTWCFWAPEMCGTREEGAAFNAYAADAWAAGLTLWCFLYGAVPFFSTNPMDLFAAIAHDPASIPDEADDSLRDLLERLLDKDPGTRLTAPEALAHSWVQSRLIDGTGCVGSSSAGTTGDRSGAVTAGAVAASHVRGAFGVSGKVSVSDDDLRNAVTETSGFVLVTKLRGGMDGIKAHARRLSNELGATVAAASALSGHGGGTRTDDTEASNEAETVARLRNRRRISSTVCVAS